MQYLKYSNPSRFFFRAGSIFFDSRLILFYVSIVCFGALIYSISISMNNFIKDSIATTLLEPKEQEKETEVSTNRIYVRKGDTLSSIFYKQNIPVLETQSILKAIKILNPHLILRIGQKISLEFNISDNDDEREYLRRTVIALDKTNFIEVSRVNSEFIAQYVEVPLEKTLVRSSTTIKSSFVEAALSVGLSNSNVNELVKIYSHQIDFQRQIHKGDVIDIILEKYNAEDGQFLHYGKVLFASLRLSGKEYNIYRYSHDGPKIKQYFTEKGKSVRSTLLKTPVPSARISSRFGKRKHPILGYTKMHKGVDFAAPRGTPIMASGDGTITHIGHNGAYGKFVQIRHNSNLSTAYAHSIRFAKGLKRGSKVKQGQTIAFVGSTGRVTGPHLHYEVRINGKQVNPLSIKSSPGITLTGKKLEVFESYKKKIHQIHKDLYTKTEITMINDNLEDL